MCACVLWVGGVLMPSRRDGAGLISSVGKGGKESDIGLITSLVTSYISKPSCIILLTVACESASPHALRAARPRC